MASLFFLFPPVSKVQATSSTNTKTAEYIITSDNTYPVYTWTSPYENGTKEVIIVYCAGGYNWNYPRMTYATNNTYTSSGKSTRYNGTNSTSYTKTHYVTFLGGTSKSGTFYNLSNTAPNWSDIFFCFENQNIKSFVDNSMYKNESITNTFSSAGFGTGSSTNNNYVTIHTNYRSYYFTCTLTGNFIYGTYSEKMRYVRSMYQKATYSSSIYTIESGSEVYNSRFTSTYRINIGLGDGPMRTKTSNVNIKRSYTLTSGQSSSSIQSNTIYNWP